MNGEILADAIGNTDTREWSARVYGKQGFAGAGKTNEGFLVPLERRLAQFVLPRVPLWLETYHLTLLTPVWSILIGYALLIQGSLFGMLLVLCVFSAFMFHTFLMLAATGEFRVSFSRFGPTEMRLALVIINTLLVSFGVRPLKSGLPYVIVFSIVGLSILAFRTQQKLWQSDMQAKQAANTE